MKVYVHDDQTMGALVDLCASMGATVVTQDDVAAQRRVASAQAPMLFLHDVDMLIVEVTQPTQELQFIIAQALLTQKPTLCVYVKNYPPRELLSFIKQQPQPRSIKTFSYIAKTLPTAINRFLRIHGDNASDRDDIPTIKYTLRLTPRVDRYLQWRADTQHESKADVLRGLLTQLSESDDKYRDDLLLFDDE